MCGPRANPQRITCMWTSFGLKSPALDYNILVPAGPIQHDVSRRVFLSSEYSRFPSGATYGYAICIPKQQQARFYSCPTVTSVRPNWLINAFTYLTTLPSS